MRKLHNMSHVRLDASPSAGLTERRKAWGLCMSTVRSGCSTNFADGSHTSSRFGDGRNHIDPYNTVNAA